MNKPHPYHKKDVDLKFLVLSFIPQKIGSRTRTLHFLHSQRTRHKLLEIKLPENTSPKRRTSVPRLPKYMKANPHKGGGLRPPPQRGRAAFGRPPPLWIPLWGLVFMYLGSLGTFSLRFWEIFSGILIPSILIWITNLFQIRLGGVLNDFCLGLGPNFLY